MTVLSELFNGIISVFKKIKFGFKIHFIENSSIIKVIKF